MNIETKFDVGEFVFKKSTVIGFINGGISANPLTISEIIFRDDGIIYRLKGETNIASEDNLIKTDGVREFLLEYIDSLKKQIGNTVKEFEENLRKVKN